MENQTRELSLKEIALRDLNSDRCVCGAVKDPQNSFCPPCYWALPKAKRLRLRITMSEGYAELYDECKDFLRIETDRLG